MNCVSLKQHVRNIVKRIEDRVAAQGEYPILDVTEMSFEPMTSQEIQKLLDTKHALKILFERSFYDTFRELA